MRYAAPLFLALLLAPAGVFAAHAPSSFEAAQSLLSASSSPGNMYGAGAAVVIAGSVGGDLSSAGGSVIAAAPITGDALLVGGSVRSQARIGGDMRAFGGSVWVEEPVAGDLVALGFTVHDSGRVGGSMFLIGANVSVLDGSSGPVTIYANNVALSGDFSSDVTIVASGRVSLAASTTIVGALTYQSPEEASLPASVTVLGGIHYTNASYLPDVGTSRTLSFISVGFFLLVRVLGALILAGLLAGLFPEFAATFVAHTIGGRLTRILLRALLGFATFVVAPILSVLLALTFVGIGLAILLFLAYALLSMLSVLYAGILVGSVIARRFRARTTVFWHDGVAGMLILSILVLVPYVGLLVAVLCTALSAGTLLLLFFSFAFPHEDETPQSL